MKKIRIQNDIRIKWRVFRYGEPEDLTSKNVVVKLLDPKGRVAPVTYEIEGNEVTIDFEGRNQSVVGVYSLLLVENGGEVGMVTLDEANVFQLVPSSKSEGGTDFAVAEVQKVEMSTDLDIPANGLSAYEIWLKHGNNGTEEDFLASFSTPKLDIDENGVLTYNGMRYQLQVIGEVLNPEPEPTPEEDEPIDFGMKVLIGQCQATRSEFEELGADNLIAYAESVGTRTSYEVTNNCVFVLAAEDVDIDSFSFANDGFMTDIAKDNGWNVSHEDIEYGGVIYNVYGYRMDTITQEHPQVYNFIFCEK